AQARRFRPAAALAVVLKWAVLLFFLAVAVLPLLWLVLNSFKTNLEIHQSPFSLPESPNLENYANAMATADLPRLFVNSVSVAVGTVFLNLFASSLAGFVLARVAWRGREAVRTVLEAGVLVPILAFMVPYFTLVTRLGLYDRLLTLVLVYSAVNIPVSIFLVTSFMRSIPKELEEAAIVDGCGFIQRFTMVILPLSRSGLVTAGTFCFIYAWNEFILAMLLTSSVSARTIQLGIRFFTSQFITDYAGMFAAIVLSILPSVLAYVFLHNKIIAGLTAGAVKG
ncbi:MAG TPA: carbohydrate ABC transporter permease, partial [Magnetospirillaceae bacterium]|nr:carbohydrate ABC transporter permease [Magnetospirillaceae bacterium]